MMSKWKENRMDNKLRRSRRMWVTIHKRQQRKNTVKKRKQTRAPINERRNAAYCVEIRELLR